MKLVLTEGIKSRLAFHRIRPATVRFMRQAKPVRFDPMSAADADAVVDAAFRLCRDADLVFQDELNFVCILMTLFGHRFHLDPRYQPISSILLNPEERGRKRRTEPMISPMIEKVWGTYEHRTASFEQLKAQLRIVTEGERPTMSSCMSPIRIFEEWQPAPLDQGFYAKNAELVASRLHILEHYSAVDLCFWTIWMIGIDFDLNPQFAWMMRSIDKSGSVPERRFRRLASWLLRISERPAHDIVDE